jgi:hypothetical protein
MRKAEELLQPGSVFLEEVAKINGFAMGNITGSQLVQLFQQDRKITVEVYRPLWLFSRALGYTTDGEEDVVHLNGFRLHRSEASIVATLVHELVHILDMHDEAHKFGHGDNSSVGKNNTAPYKLDAIAERIILDEQQMPKKEAKKTAKQGSFVFRDGQCYEAPRSELFRLTKRHLTTIS